MFNISSSVKSHISGNVFESNKINLSQQSTNELENEKINKKSYQKNSESIIVAFRDSRKQKGDKDEFVTLEISNENFIKLQEKFDKNDFYNKKGGLVRLTNEAEKYISSWFDDVYYDRGFKDAIDNNGYISSVAYANTKSFYASKIDISFNSTSFPSLQSQEIDYNETLIQSNMSKKDMENFDKIESRMQRYNDSIDKEINELIKADTNIDSVISIEEDYQENYNEKNINKIVSKEIIRDITTFWDKYWRENWTNPNQNPKGIATKTQIMDEFMKKLLPTLTQSSNDVSKLKSFGNIMEKLSTQGESSITDEEKNILVDIMAKIQKNETKNETFHLISIKA